MPVSELTCKRRRPHRRSYRFNGARQGQVQDADSVNGTTHYDKTACVCGPRTMDPAHTATHNGTKPRNMKNGLRSKSRETPFVSREENKRTPVYSGVKQPECNGSVLVNGSRSLRRGTLCTTSAQEPTTLYESTATKTQRKKKKPWHNKRKNPVARVENSIPELIEDWEGEIQEVKISNWEEMCFGTEPYGPEDVLHFSLRDLSLGKNSSSLWQLISNKYLPATHHRPPIDWFRYKRCTEPGQFSDAED